MQTLAPGIVVNGIKITPEEINAEVQYHPASSFPEAKYQAMQALVIREMLLQRAVEMGLCDREDAVKKTDDVIEQLLEQEIEVPQADKTTCERYYKNNKERFFTSPLFEVSHILYLAPIEDKDLREEAQQKSINAIHKLNEDPTIFEVIAKDESSCTSSKDGGRLGQVSKGQTMPAFERALFKMQEGELSQEPVETSVGYHVIKVHKRVEGKQLPFDVVDNWIKEEIETKSWNRAFSQYIQILSGKAEISGFRFEGAKTPLVQ